MIVALVDNGQPVIDPTSATPEWREIIGGSITKEMEVTSTGLKEWT